MRPSNGLANSFISLASSIDGGSTFGVSWEPAENALIPRHSRLVKSATIMPLSRTAIVPRRSPYGAISISTEPVSSFVTCRADSHQSSHPLLSMVATPERSDAITLLSAVLLSRFPRQRYHRRRPCCKVEGHGVRAARAPHESERRARTMLSHHPSRFSDAPERSDDSTARSAAPCRDHALVPAPASSLRMDLPRSSMRMAPWTRRSRMASARVASLSCRCQSATGN